MSWKADIRHRRAGIVRTAGTHRDNDVQSTELYLVAAVITPANLRRKFYLSRPIK